MGLLEVDLQGKVDYVNDSFCLLTGYEQQELLKKSAADLLLTDSSVKRMQSIQENRTHGVGHTYELELKCKNGESRVFLISGVPKLDISGNICGSIGIHVAVSDPTSIKTKVGDHYKDVEEVKDPYRMLNINKLAKIKERTIDAMILAESGLIAEDVYVLKSHIRNLQQSLKATYQIISR
jgi:PAS domain S-box-containing protein